MKSIYFNDQHHAFRSKIRNFIATRVLPFVESWEKQGHVAKSIFKEMGDLGILGLVYPTTIGGANLDFMYSAIFLEELGRTGYIGFRTAIAVHSYMAVSYINHTGNDQLKLDYLQPAITGAKIACLAITEPGAGSDLAAMQTTAVTEDDSIIINGCKKYIANAVIADFIILAAKINNNESKKSAAGMSIIIVDSKSSGVTINKIDNFNWLSSGTAEIIFKNVRVPKSNIIGIPGMGLIYIMQCMQLERIAAGFLAIGGIDHCLDTAWHYISEREAFGRKISKFQVIRHKMADLVSQLEALRQFAYHTAWLYDNDELPIAEASMLKLNATELACKAASECIHMFGAYGCQNNAAISRVYRDTFATSIAGGTSEVMRDIIAQITFDEAGWRKKTSIAEQKTETTNA